MASSPLSDLRDALSADLHLIDRDGSSSEDFIKKFCADHKQTVAQASPELIKIALTKILHDVKGRKTPIASTKGQGELFSDYEGPRFFSVHTSSNNKKINIKLPDMKCSQLQEWLLHHDKQRKEEDSKITEVKRILGRIEGHWSEDTTVREALKAAKQAETKKTATGR